MKISELNFGEDSITLPDSELEIKGLCRKPEEILDGYIFFDLPSVSGIDKSYEFTTPPTAIVTQRPSAYSSLKIPIIAVNDSRRAYAYAYSSFLSIDYGKLKIIGITGTNGKSSISIILKEMLIKNGKKCGLIGTGIIEATGERLSQKYYSMTTPDAEILYPALLEMQRRGVEYVIMEISSHSLSLMKCEPIKFSLAVFSGLSPEHLDFHKNMEDYFLSKRRLFTKAEKSVIFTDGKYGKRLFSEFKENSVSAGLYSGIIRAEDIKEKGIQGSEFTLCINGERLPVSIRLPGIYNIENSLLSLSCVNALSLNLKSSIEAISNINFIKGRTEIISGKVTVIRDFAHTELALENLLKMIKMNIIPEQKMTVVLGCGGERDRQKRPLMAKCASIYADRVIITEDNSRGEELASILSDIISGADCERIGIIADRALAIEYAIKTASDGDTVVVVGKGAEDYIIKGNAYCHFDERKIIEEALAKRV